MANAVLDRATFVRPIAHRGLHDAERGVLENSAPAFAAAIAGGFGIECDVRSAVGGMPVVFHDADCQRLLGLALEVASLGATEFAALNYPDGSPVLTLAALLALVEGRVPVLVELKDDWKGADMDFLTEVARLASAYRGPLAVMSFEPQLMAAMSQLAPAVPRGLVAADFATDPQVVRVLGAPRAASLAEMEAFETAGASFAAYHVEALATPAIRRLRQDGLPVFAWTVRDERQLAIAVEHADAPIFEGGIRSAIDHLSCSTGQRQ
ncbi:MAG: glycerophosphodiester phosphodiesterase [Alphaproteobacteria bacterium]|nr:glycerophosphodiester phosphodiesterase [Alphaproteobacteria bacterium]